MHKMRSMNCENTEGADADTAVVLLSGGIDSSTCLAIANSEVQNCIALTFQYGQRHKIEIDAAKDIARYFNVVKHIVIPIRLGAHVESALTTECIEVPKNNTCNTFGADIPVTYVPARNTIFLSYALAIAENTDADYIYIGVSSVDYSGYPDCRPEFIEAFQKLADVATKRAVEGHPVEIITPLQHLDKAQTIKKGVKLGVDYSLTHSCYDPDEFGRACGCCDSCILRRMGFDTAGISDPTVYCR